MRAEPDTESADGDKLPSTGKDVFIFADAIRRKEPKAT